MQSDLLLFKRVLLTIVTFTGIALTSQGQIPLTIDKAMEIAQENSPSLRRSYMNLERYKQNLLAQKASLKSRFSLNLNPVDYNKNRRFDNRLSQWYTNETFNTSGTFQVDQPILWTDGTISLINRFGWQDNSSIIEGDKTSNRAFSNDLYLQLTQPIFTYNKRKMELKQIEYDYENANISYALQQLNTEKSITDQFYSVYMAQSNLEISREELVNAQQSYDIIKNKVEADLAAKDELFQAELDIRQNHIMKILTIVTTVFLPLSLVAGWYGMNFTGMPELSWDYGYPAVIVGSVVIVLLTLWIMKKKKFW